MAAGSGDRVMYHDGRVVDHSTGTALLRLSATLLLQSATVTENKLTPLPVYVPGTASATGSLT
jgi:hypothetical protein